MRKEPLQRLAGEQPKTRSSTYIHYHFLQSDIYEALSRHASGILLDLGCGNKPYEKWYEPLCEHSIGCDVVQSSHDRADALCEGTSLPFGQGTFNTIFCSQVMEHVFDHAKLLRECHQVLQPGGHLVLTVPFCWELHEEPHDFFRFSKHGLQQLFEDAGFTHISIKSNGGKWAATFQMLLNTIYSSFRNRSWRTRLVKFLFSDLKLTWLINKFAIWLDEKNKDEIWTLNYLVVARK